MKRSFSILLALFLLALPLLAAGGGGNDQGHYTEEPMFQSRPDPTRERYFGGIGTTGLKPRIYPGVILKVEEMAPGSPSDGKFAKQEIITGINGTTLKGLNPFVVMGNALTKAEATDGRMVFDVTSADGKTQRKETVTIPALGAYSKTWPLDCPKSKRIIDEAAAFYSDPKKFNEGGIPGALTCLFLLSTGDDQYLPRVKACFDAFPKDVSATRMLSDPNESWYVKAGAMMALKLAPAKDIQERYKLIQPWIKHSDWWMREAAFFALSGLAKDDAL